ncbi:unnamed protein product [Heterobilharzia americana]|nr:unnamed protein product [Heterobilharzia americana]
MRNGSLLPERLLVEWFVQLVIALQYMHERNVLHRDLKTRNIFLTRTDIVKLGDLGIARVLESSSSMATTLIGTPYYMSPELFANRPYNHKKTHHSLLEATKDRNTNCWNHSCIEDDVQNINRSAETKSDVPLESTGSIDGVKVLNVEIENETEQPLDQKSITSNNNRDLDVNIPSALKDPNSNTFDEGSEDKTSGILQSEERNISESQQNIFGDSDLPVESTEDIKQSLDSDHKCSLKHVLQLDGCEIKSRGTNQDKSLHRYLSDARLRRRQRRRMSEAEGDQHHFQLFQHENKQESNLIHKSLDSIDACNDNNNNNRNKLSKTPKFHSHSFRVLPVSMLPKLRKPGNRADSDPGVHKVTKYDILNNDSESNEHKSSELSTDQINCVTTSITPAVFNSSSDISNITKNSLVSECKSAPQKNERTSENIISKNHTVNTTGTSNLSNIFKKKDLTTCTEIHNDHNDDRENGINSQLKCQKDAEIEEIVNYLADTLKDGCHPGAPVIFPRCKRERKTVSSNKESKNCVKEQQKPLVCNSEDNGPIEPKEETINRSVHLKQRFVELHKECLKNVGVKKLHEAYEILDQDLCSVSQEALLKKILGVDIYSQYMNKIWQLKLLGQNAFEQNQSN